MLLTEVMGAGFDEDDSVSLFSLLNKPTKNTSFDVSSACFGPITGMVDSYFDLHKDARGFLFDGFPVDRCTTPYFSTKRSDCVPLPLPGGPKRMRLNISLICLGVWTNIMYES